MLCSVHMCMNLCLYSFTIYMFVQSRNLCNLEIVLHILKIRANLEIAQYVCTIRLHNLEIA